MSGKISNYTYCKVVSTFSQVTHPIFVANRYQLHQGDKRALVILLIVLCVLPTNSSRQVQLETRKLMFTSNNTDNIMRSICGSFLVDNTIQMLINFQSICQFPTKKLVASRSLPLADSANFADRSSPPRILLPPFMAILLPVENPNQVTSPA